MSKQRVNSRLLNSKIEVITLTKVSDGFGGSTLSETSLGFFYAHVQTIGPTASYKDYSNIEALGVKDVANGLKITVRYNAVFENPNDLKIKLNGEVLTLLSVNIVDLRKTAVEIIANK